MESEQSRNTQFTVRFIPPSGSQLHVYASLVCEQLDNLQAAATVDTNATAKDLAHFLHVLGRLEAKRLNTENPN